jgi:predicted HTH domain antitoxin
MRRSRDGRLRLLQTRGLTVFGPRAPKRHPLHWVIHLRRCPRSGRRYTVGAMRAVTIEIPENVLVGSGQSTEDFAKEAKLLLFAKLFELGRVSSGKAAEVCGMTRVEFLLAAGKLGVSPVQLDAVELARELADA